MAPKNVDGQSADLPPVAFTGVRSFVPWKGQTILKWAVPTLIVDPAALSIRSGTNLWRVEMSDVRAVVVDPKGIVIEKTDGTAARFKASKSKIREVVSLLDERNIPTSESPKSTYWMVNGEPDSR